MQLDRCAIELIDVHRCAIEHFHPLTQENIKFQKLQQKHIQFLKKYNKIHNDVSHYTRGCDFYIVNQLVLGYYWLVFLN